MKMKISIVDIFKKSIDRSDNFSFLSAAIDDMDSLRKHDATTIADRLEKHLSHRPDFLSKSRIKKLRGQQKADYRLRVGNYRVFYTINYADGIV